MILNFVIFFPISLNDLLANLQPTDDPSINKRFVVGVDRSKMRLYDVELQAQEEIVDNGQEQISKVFEEPSFGKKTKEKQYEGFSKLKV